MPPCTREDQEDLARQAIAAGFVPRTKKPPPEIPLTCVMNSPNDKWLLECLEAKCEVLPKVIRRSISYDTPHGRVSYVIRLIVPYGDVGETAVMVRRNGKGKKQILYGVSNAETLLSDNDE